MNQLEIHENIYKKLDYFIKENKIPHIIFYGPSGCGKKHILYNFINKIYKNNKQIINSYVMFVNCAHSKGIRFIRDELKFFAKTNIHNKNKVLFKSIVLFNADQLTTDAQSALRRCIEQFSYTTRFFVVVENENRLLKPILSRFCNIYIPTPIINKMESNIYDYNKKNIRNNFIFKKRYCWLKKQISNKKNFESIKTCYNFVKNIYERGYNGLDIIQIIENIKNKNKYLFLIYFDKIRNEFRNEELFMFNILYLYFMRKNLNLENILEM